MPQATDASPDDANAEIVRSKAYSAFHLNISDVRDLMKIHQEKAGETPGRKWGVAPLNKSAVVLLCAGWEAYCGEIVAEWIEHVVTYGEPEHLPPALKDKVRREIVGGGAAAQMLMWDLAGEGWRTFLRERLERLAEERARYMNAPRSNEVKRVFSEHAGHPDITAAWSWPKMSNQAVRTRLDEFVDLRNAIAHKPEQTRKVNKQTVYKYLVFIGRLVDFTDALMEAHAREVTGQSMFGPTC